MVPLKTSAQKLEGLLLDGGWKVLQRMEPGNEATGGTFSEQYVVEDATGRRAFLKALDYSRALRSPDPAAALKTLTESFVFERDLLNRCRDKNLDRIVTAISDGTIRNEGAWDGGVVQYLVFELADGDLRAHAASSAAFNAAWKLRCLHHMAAGLRQLHGEDIAHQDVKPSNILVFESKTTKLTDLGRASAKGVAPPHEDKPVAGDPSYAPPELLYHHLDPNWNARRLGCDLYLLGSMVVFCFAGVGLTRLLIKEMNPAHRPKTWTGTYTDVIPYLREAFERVIESVRPEFPDSARDELTQLLRQLCEPEPHRRGDRLAVFGTRNQFSLERFISIFDRLAKKAELEMVRRAR